MISCHDIQNTYNKLYAEVRRYLWDFAAVEALANLEIACYKTCPDLHEIRTALDQLSYYTHDVATEDEDLSAAVEALRELIDSDDTTYAKLNKVNEVITQ